MRMKVSKTPTRKAVKASSRQASSIIRRRRVVADDEMMDEDIIDDVPAEEATVTVDPEATELVFEAEDVAELVAEITGQEVSVDVDTDEVIFTVGEDEYKVEPDGDEEILEASSKILRGKKPVKASRRVAGRRPVGRARK